MSGDATALALRRQRLQMRAAGERGALAAQLGALRPVFSAADGIRAGVRWVKENPEWVAGAVVMVVVARPRGTLRFARRAFFVWQGARRLRRFVDEALRGDGGRRG